VAYVETQKRGDKTYYYITKNVRIGISKWKKVRKYIGTEKPTDKKIKSTILEIEKEIKLLNFDTKSDSFISKHNLEFLEDVKASYDSWLKKTPKSVQKKTNDNFIIRFTYDSNAIEGNRLTLRETGLVLKDKLMPSGARAKDVQEAINGRKCMDYLLKYEGVVNGSLIKKINKILLNDIEDVVYSGRYRFFGVDITGTTYKPPHEKEVNRLMTNLIKNLKNNTDKYHPFELACFFHIEFVRIHPFEDGNGRTGRSIMNYILRSKGYPMLFIPIEKRLQYYEAIDKYNEGNKKGYYADMFLIIRDQLKEIVDKK
jgi:Fic family protein